VAQVSAQGMPWTLGEVESFNLNMSYLYDQCSTWMEKSPAGSLVASGLKEYQKGLSLVRSGALKMQSAAQYNDSAHQKALEKGASQMESGIPYLNGGLAQLERWY
jgi:exonuclease VII small subunit